MQGAVSFPVITQPEAPELRFPRSSHGIVCTFCNFELNPFLADSGSAAVYTKQEDELFIMNCDIDDLENQAEMEEKTRLINQVLELQHTLEDLSARVDAVKEENLKLKSENQVLGQYIENLMSASSVFQTTDTKSKRK
ncbi:short coiled-coil protein B isoform 1-T1 [Anableps anableps]